MTLAVGACMNHYEILAPLGAGGMGEVYLAEDARLGRKVAIEVLPPRSRMTQIACAASSRKRGIAWEV